MSSRRATHDSVPCSSISAKQSDLALHRKLFTKPVHADPFSLPCNCPLGCYLEQPLVKGTQRGPDSRRCEP